MTLTSRLGGPAVATLIAVGVVMFLTSCDDDCPSCPTQPDDPPNLPEAVFDIIPINNSFHALDTLLFDASRSSQGDFGPLRYAWDFGDGAYDSGLTARHVYADEGKYNAMLAVTDSLDHPDTCRSLVTVWSPFAREEFMLSLSRTDEFLGPEFLVAVASRLDYYPEGQYYLVLDVRESNGREIIYIADRSEGIYVNERHTIAVDTFEYSSLAGIWWPEDSAMLILTLWQTAVGYTRVAEDTVLVDCSAAPSGTVTTLTTEVVKEGSGLGRIFTVTTDLQMEHHEPGEYTLETDIRNAAGWDLYIGKRSLEFTLVDSSYADTVAFVYDWSSGALLWSSDSAMVIMSVWRELSLLNRSRVAIDTTIVGY